MQSVISIAPKSIVKDTAATGKYVSCGGINGKAYFKVLHSKIDTGKKITVTIMNSSNAIGSDAKEVLTMDFVEQNINSLPEIIEIAVKPKSKEGEFYAIKIVHDNATEVVATGEICFNKIYN